MWAEAARRLRGYDEAVLTGIDVDGYPFSVRVPTAAYDGGSGLLRAELPAAVRAAAGPAGLLCHYHDDKLWNIRTLQVRGRLEDRDGGWTFVTTAFTPPPTPAPMAMIAMVRGAHAAATRYLARRDLDRPVVNWAAIKEVQRRARRG